MTTLLVSSYAPALGSGRGMRTFGLVRALATLEPVAVLHGRFGGEPGPEFLAIERASYHALPPPARARRALAMARGLASGVPAPVARGVLPGLARETARLAGGDWRIVADDPMAAVALSALARRRPVVYSAHNLESAFRTDWGPPARVRAFERRLLERSAETWMPSRADLDGARALAPGAILRLMPNVVDVAAIRPAAPGPAARRVLMVGDFTYAPNREALAFLLDAVMPAVWALDGSVAVAVAGRGLEGVPWPADARARRLGFVADLAAAYAEAGCAIVPLLRGGGSPLKFVEALAYGVPVVATPRAAAGLEARAGEHYLEGADAAGLARAVIAALGDRGRAVAAAGRALAEREHSIESLARRLAP